jgi:FAD:protein FMN transferase
MNTTIKTLQISFILLVMGQVSLLSQTSKFTFQRPKMGSPFVITVFADDSLILLPIIEKVYLRVDTLNQIFSDYLETSEINTVCHNVKIWQPISNELHHVLKISEKANQMSEGAFDVTVGHIVKIWRKVRKTKQMPENTILLTALHKTGFKNIQIAVDSPLIRFHTEGVLLDFGGIVKGYAAQEVVDILTKNGFPYCLVDAGGDLVAGKKPRLMPAELGGWKIGVSLPNSDRKLMPHLLSIENQAIATSGDMYHFFEHKGKRYSHIVNPKTGLGLTHQRNVTVIAPDGATADWLATACSILPIRKAKRLIKKYPQTALLILENKNGKIKSIQSSQFAKYFSLN